MTGGPVKVLIVDDAPIVRNVLTKELSRDSRIEVVGAAEDAYQARDMIIERNPDVISLDLLMPRMDGFEFLENYIKTTPEDKRAPVLVYSGKDLSDVQSELLKDKVVGLVKKDDASMENLSSTISGLIKES